MADQPQFFAFFFSRPQGFAQPPLIGGNHPRRSRKNMRGGAVILLQPHHMRAGEILLEAQDITHLGPAPAIDRLVIIPHTADVFMAACQQAQPQVLRDIGILILVHQNIFEPALILGQNIRIALKYLHHMQQQITKIHRVQDGEAGLIGFVKRHPAPVKGPGLAAWHLGGGQRLIFPAVDNARQHARRVAFFVDILGADQLFEQAELVIGIQNRKAAFQADQLGMAAQKFYTNRMKRAQPRHAFHRATKVFAHPLLHLAGGFVGKRHRQNLVGPCASGMQQMRNARGQRFGLAGARPCQHQNRPVELFHSLLLLGVQPVHISHRPRPHCLP